MTTSVPLRRARRGGFGISHEHQFSSSDTFSNDSHACPDQIGGQPRHLVKRTVRSLHLGRRARCEGIELPRVRSMVVPRGRVKFVHVPIMFNEILFEQESTRSIAKDSTAGAATDLIC